MRELSISESLPIFRVAIWTVHFGIGNDGLYSSQRIADAIKLLNVDVIGLLETDAMRIVMGNRDLPLSINQYLNYHISYGPSTLNHTWGCSLISRYPIVSVKNYNLPSPDGEIACAIHATLNITNYLVDVVEETPLDRKLQSEMLAKLISSISRPVIFLGYVVAKPHSEEYHRLFEKQGSLGPLVDIDETDNDRWCQYIGFKGNNIHKMTYARISHARISDTEIQAASFTVLSLKSDPMSEYLKRLTFSQKLFNARSEDEHYFHYVRYFYAE
ncbi:hypothetical protein O9G_000024 [Rozella allomycis CSF55]|uniref:PGAP2IP C-terminal nuclease-like domain-containing protein n=1 Tax=Rozella allomycis (strain CSF55) TaxID=988480 RepID=A0A075ASP0_ROZAC|nr:hypothetical protein O9G_000024 [Rozella allomycis CSF55]|eukprot:EPZ31548.1 hypothetical protein O9G_000024 [Rozella allomycis CSF55]